MAKTQVLAILCVMEFLFPVCQNCTAHTKSKLYTQKCQNFREDGKVKIPNRTELPKLKSKAILCAMEFRFSE